MCELRLASYSPKYATRSLSNTPFWAYFYEKLEWPNGDKNLIKDQEITLVVQINGKKRGLIIAKKDLDEKEVLIKAKKIDNIKKNLKDKKIVKNIFVKNKIINFITS